MKQILFIAPHSFPIKSSESICNSKLAYALAQAGYKVDVFTCADDSTYPKDSEVDTVLKNSSNLRIFTVNNPNIFFSRQKSLCENMRLIPHHLNIFFQTGYFYNGISTPYLILKEIERVIKENGGFHYDAMITRGFATDIVGIKLKKKYGVKWIANWNDPYPCKRFPAPYGLGYDAKLSFFENIVYNDIQKYADIHTFPSARLRDYMLKCFTRVNSANTRVIHHMAHSGLTHLFECKRSDNLILKIVSCGSVGAPRKPETFLNALSIVLKDTNIKVKLFFVGFYSEELKKLSNKLNLSEVVEFIPPISYSDCMKFISSCDISLIVETSCSEGIYLPTKCVDAFQCTKPIFCVSPKIGTLRDIVEKSHIGYIADIDNIADIVVQIQKMLNDYQLNNLPVVNKEISNNFFEDYIVVQYSKLI